MCVYLLSGVKVLLTASILDSKSSVLQATWSEDAMLWKAVGGSGQRSVKWIWMKIIFVKREWNLKQYFSVNILFIKICGTKLVHVPKWNILSNGRLFHLHPPKPLAPQRHFCVTVHCGLSPASSPPHHTPCMWDRNHWVETKFLFSWLIWRGLYSLVLFF